MSGRRLQIAAVSAVAPLLIAAGNNTAPSHEIVVNRSIGGIVLGEGEAAAFRALLAHSPRGFYEKVGAFGLDVGAHCFQVDEAPMLLNFCARNSDRRVISIYAVGVRGSFCFSGAPVCLGTAHGVDWLKATYGSRLKRQVGPNLPTYLLRAHLTQTSFEAPSYTGPRSREIARVDEVQCSATLSC